MQRRGKRREKVREIPKPHEDRKIYKNRPVYIATCIYSMCGMLITNMWGEYPNQSVMSKNDNINEC